jgi:Bacterial Ig-like domain (group 2)
MNQSNQESEAKENNGIQPKTKENLTRFERHPNWTSLFVWLIASLIGFAGLRESDGSGSGLGIILIIVASVLGLGAEIWNIHEKGRSQFNLLWNLVPYIGFFMVLLLEHKLVNIEVISEDKLLAGSSIQLTADGIAINGSFRKIKGASWESSNKNVATVDSDGVVTGITPGNCEIIVTSDGVTCKPIFLTVTGG